MVGAVMTLGLDPGVAARDGERVAHSASLRFQQRRCRQVQVNNGTARLLGYTRTVPVFIHYRVKLLLSKTIVAGADPGSSAFLTPGSGMGKKSRSGSGIRSWIFRELRNNFFGKNLNSFIRIRDLGSGINIPDPQHCNTK
jgi:hypothetical protein